MSAPSVQQQYAKVADLAGVRLALLMLTPFVLLTAATLAARVERGRIVEASSLAILPAPIASTAIELPVPAAIAWPVVDVPPAPEVRTQAAAIVPELPLPVSRLPVIASTDLEPRVCTPPPRPEPLAYTTAEALTAEAFGERLARAARQQLDDFVIYSDRYVPISYPMGDVLPVQGACTDVVVRAYRQLGIDLQELVQRARLGTGDKSIDHRRTETLRRLFARYGESLAPSSRGEDFKPGDIVTYFRRHNPAPRSRSHIAIVVDIRGPSGNPMIVHNRGSGPELEDALFLDRMTGHYRFRGAGIARVAAKGGRGSHGGSRGGS